MSKYVLLSVYGEGEEAIISKPTELSALDICASFARANPAAIVLIARSAANLAETKRLTKDVNPSTQMLSVAVDVNDESGIKDAFQEVVQRFGIPHVLINSAGVTSLNKIAEEDSDAWWNVQVSPSNSQYNGSS